MFASSGTIVETAYTDPAQLSHADRNGHSVSPNPVPGLADISFICPQHRVNRNHGICGPASIATGMPVTLAL